MENTELEKRLDKIDKQLDSIQQLMLDTALQQKDIDLLKEEIKQLKEEQKTLRDTVEQIKNQPVKSKAEKWSRIENWIFAGVLTFLAGCIGFIIKSGMVGNVIK